MNMTEDAINFYLIFITAAIWTYVWLSFFSLHADLFSISSILTLILLGVHNWSTEMLLLCCPEVWEVRVRVGATDRLFFISNTMSIIELYMS